MNAAVLMAAAMLLPYFGEHLAKASGLGQSFFGTLFIAASTSLPEVVVSVTAIRMGTIDLAIGNIFGSNIFNIAILALDDILYTKGPIFQFTSPNHIVPVLGTIIITAIGIIGIVFKEEKKWKLAIDTALIVLVYLLMMGLLYYIK
jgi:cation:H+ antiporter